MRRTKAKHVWQRIALVAAIGGAACCPQATTRSSDDAVVTQGGPVTAVMEGRVSYYHDSLAGNHTANGEIYDPKKLTAASRTLPFGTRVRVTRLDNGRSVVVRINDRGPFGRRKRIMDLSRAAAEKLHMIGAGVVQVRAEVLGGR